ncbi:hypothetical protein [Cupriavidus consociatus]|uniref:hypothetical protein n=1 Tax=Cupriavidus consociatus TaxID=2821357 RepID=UPI001AE32D9F|nr:MULTISPECIES: hypothetical protein [unclassified Cupriavidus]MBP0621198.1 hypothetical protein [Cupriavidus sp. LEh25]MDK2657869.1 hypothetical protein [Cupriavidus sp. LEh21]
MSMRTAVVSDGPPRNVTPAGARSFLLDDLPALPETALAMAEQLYACSARDTPQRQRLRPWESLESRLQSMCLCTEAEAMIALHVLSDIRQRAAERGSSGAAWGAAYARAMHLLRRPPTSMPKPAAVEPDESRPLVQHWGGGVVRTHLVSAPTSMAVERTFYALRDLIGVRPPHTHMQIFDEKGRLVGSDGCRIDHVPLLIAPMSDSHWARELLMALLQALESQDLGGELIRAKFVGIETYLLGRMHAANVGALVFTGFTSQHLVPELASFWRLLSRIAREGFIVVLCATAAVREALPHPTFRALFPPAQEILAYDPGNYAGITQAMWELFARRGPMPAALSQILPETHGLRDLVVSSWVLYNRLVNQHGMDPSAAAEGLVDKACIGRLAIARDLYGRVLGAEPISKSDYAKYQDYLPWETDVDDDASSSAQAGGKSP